jgi:hypothetical protein
MSSFALCSTIISTRVAVGVNPNTQVRVVVDHVVRNVYVLQRVSYVVLGVLALEGRVVDL